MFNNRAASKEKKGGDRQTDRSERERRDKTRSSVLLMYSQRGMGSPGRFTFIFITPAV